MSQKYAKEFDPKSGGDPAPRIVVATCMDPRLSDLPGILGLPQADIEVIRTGGPAVTQDVLSELVVSTRALNHTCCGFTTFTGGDLNVELSGLTGDSSPAPMRLFSYKNPEEKTRNQMKIVRSHPWIAKEIPVRGFVFDVATGLISEVQGVSQDAAA